MAGSHPLTWIGEMHLDEPPTEPFCLFGTWPIAHRLLVMSLTVWKTHCPFFFSGRISWVAVKAARPIMTQTSLCVAPHERLAGAGCESVVSIKERPWGLC
ncbi:hypothetical protein AB0D04_13585 [Streptomyces sp. NPDC048483]|uniref:hypothetical protein n=1 Tax=Streptomyces sp. NPDC048483 TaxID=3154927 RepID=UPI00341C65FC